MKIVRVPSGVEPSTDELREADLVIIGGEVVKNRYGRAGGRIEDVLTSEQIEALPPEESAP